MASFSRQLIPGLPSLSTLGLSVQDVLPPVPQTQKTNDGTKRVEYRPVESRNVRPTPGKSLIKNQATGFNPDKAPIRPTPGLPTAPVVQTPKQTQRPPSKPIQREPRQEDRARMSRTFPTLAIMPHGDAILDLVSKHPVIAVDSPTGTGKTRYIPYLIADKQGKKVRVAIPTTVAVRDAYNFIYDFTKMDVGYAAGREIKYSPNTQLVYGTTGHFTQKIINLCRGTNGQITEDLRKQVRGVLGDIFFVDEVHTNTVDITQLVGLINFIFRKDSVYQGPKIVFSTATFNHGDIMDFFPDFPIYKVDVNAFPVEIKFLDEMFDPRKDDVDEKIIKILKSELETWTESKKKYHVIVFRPGVNEVDTTVEALEKTFRTSGSASRRDGQTKSGEAFRTEDDIEFYPAYSRLTPVELDEIFQASSKMKVVIGTNIIESSITIEDVAVVINDMLVKTAETSATGGDRLVLSYISQAEAQQRKGRTGRTMPGRAYYLCNEMFFNGLPKFRAREIDRVPIYNTVLQLLDAGLSPTTILKITSDRYDQARRTLVEFGMIVRQENVYSVTETGRFVSGIPLSVQNSYMVYLAFQNFKKSPTSPVEQIVFRTVLAVASMLEVFEPGYFFVPRRGRNETEGEYQARRDVHIEKYHEKFRGETDIHTLVNIFWEMMEFVRVTKSYDRSVRGGFYDYIKNFAVDNSMNNKKLREMLIVLRDVEEAALNALETSSQIDLQMVIPDGGYENLGDQTAEIFGKAYFSNVLTRGFDRKGQIVYLNKAGTAYRIGGRSSFNRIIFSSFEGPGRIVAAEMIEVQGKKGVVNLASILVNEKYAPPVKDVPVE